MRVAEIVPVGDLVSCVIGVQGETAAVVVTIGAQEYFFEEAGWARAIVDAGRRVLRVIRQPGEVIQCIVVVVSGPFPDTHTEVSVLRRSSI